MRRIFLLFLAGAAAFAAGDAWTKVRELERGTELRIYRAKAKEPLRAKFDRAGDESLIVITKNGQESIPKEEITRLDRRRAPAEPLVKETSVERKIPPRGAETYSNTIPGRTTSVKTRLGVPAGFETIYPAPAAEK
ncbi:MAG: hypothetical protein ACE141_19120 [Bryobacteraceae bacterium]